MARSPNNTEEDSTGFLEKGDERESDVGFDYDPPKPYHQRQQLQWRNIARGTAHWTGHVLLGLLLILIFKQSVLVCLPRPMEKVLIRPEEGTSGPFVHSGSGESHLAPC